MVPLVYPRGRRGRTQYPWVVGPEGLPLDDPRIVSACGKPLGKRVADRSKSGHCNPLRHRPHRSSGLISETSRVISISDTFANIHIDRMIELQ